MKPAQPLEIASDVIQLLVTRGFITADHDFDSTKIDSVQEDAQMAADIEAIFIKHGVSVPTKMNSIIQMLPLLAMLIR